MSRGAEPPFDIRAVVLRFDGARAVLGIALFSLAVATRILAPAVDQLP